MKKLKTEIQKNYELELELAKKETSNKFTQIIKPLEVIPEKGKKGPLTRSKSGAFKHISEKKNKIDQDQQIKDQNQQEVIKQEPPTHNYKLPNYHEDEHENSLSDLPFYQKHKKIPIKQIVPNVNVNTNNILHQMPSGISLARVLTRSQSKAMLLNLEASQNFNQQIKQEEKPQIKFGQHKTPTIRTPIRTPIRTRRQTLAYGGRKDFDDIFGIQTKYDPGKEEGNSIFQNFNNNYHVPSMLEDQKSFGMFGKQSYAEDFHKNHEKDVFGMGSIIQKIPEEDQHIPTIIEKAKKKLIERKDSGHFSNISFGVNRMKKKPVKKEPKPESINSKRRYTKQIARSDLPQDNFSFIRTRSSKVKREQSQILF